MTSATQRDNVTAMPVLEDELFWWLPPDVRDILIQWRLTMGLVSDQLKINRDDLSEDEQAELREHLVKQAMKSMTINKLVATARKRENARLKEELAASASEQGNVTRLRK